MSGPSKAHRGGDWASGAFTDYVGVLFRPAARRRIEKPYRAGADGDATFVLNLRHYWHVLTVYWRPVALVSAAMFLLAMAHLHTATYKYTATLIVSPVQQGNSSSAMSGLAGLASLAGVSLPGNNSQTQLQLYLAALKSTDVASTLARDPSISHVLFRDAWDPASGRWRDPGGGPMRAIKDAVKAVLGYPPNVWHPPGTKEMLALLERQIDVNSAPLSPIVTITYDNKDPLFAEKFIVALHKAADDHLRTMTVARTTKYNEYLLRQLETVTSADQRQAMILSLSNNETMLTQASADVSYSVDVFSPPTASAAPTSPKPLVVLFAALLMGAILGSALVLWRCA
jgi:uncharacterized protein involved in exopolysaccharide biosynthesis